MAPEGGMDQAITSAAALWPALISRAGLTGASKQNEGAYDHDLIAALRKRLFPSERSSKSLEELLARSSLSAESLIRAFFATLAPFAVMKIDILTMLSHAEAKESGDALRIRFNFDPSNSPLDLLLSEFREQMERIAEATVERPRIVLPRDLWAIHNVGRSGHARQPTDMTADMAAWKNSYREGDSFLPLEGNWKTGRDDIDTRLDRVVDLVNAVLAAFRRYGENHAELRDKRSDPNLWRTPDPIGLTLAELWQLESDFWPRAIVDWIGERRHDVRVGNEALIQRVLQEIDNLLPQIDETEIALTQVKLLEDLLNLPVWKRRNDVYAVWLGAQIYISLSKRGWQFLFHVENDQLEFAFRGVHLATLLGRSSPQVLFWWTELRSHHDDLPSGHRTSGIQPDYRIQRVPLSERERDVLVIEAKQHLRSSTREFTDAIRDYAFACPRAMVMLANYGPISDRAYKAIEPEFLDRSQLHCLVHPGEPSNVEKFRSSIVSAIETAVGAPTRPFANALMASLSWGSSPTDLDLHVFREGANSEHAYYNQPHLPDIDMSSDVRNGWGPESAKIAPTDATFVVAVNQYSDDGDLSASNAVVEISCTGGSFTPMKFHVPRGKSGRWWRVARIDMKSSLIADLNDLSDVDLA